MTIFPLYITSSAAACPELPPLDTMPEEVQRAVAHLTPYERRLSQDELIRDTIKIVSLAKTHFPGLATGSFHYCSASRFGTAHSFSLVKPAQDEPYILVHFNKKSDGYKRVKGGISISPVVHLTNGSCLAWITPNKTTRSATIEFTEQFPFLREFGPGSKGIISSLCLPKNRGKDGYKPAMLQPLGWCDLKEYLYEQEIPGALQLHEATSHLNRETIILQIMHSLLSGLETIHSKGIIHNDVKPANVVLFYNAESQTILAKFIDFGSSVATEEGIYLSDPRGTYGYLPPEFYYYCEDVSQVDEMVIPYNFTDDFPGHTQAKDIWALGQLFHELLFQEKIDPESPLFKKMISSVKSDHLPTQMRRFAAKGRIETLIAHMLHPNLQLRATATAAREEVDRLLSNT